MIADLSLKGNSGFPEPAIVAAGETVDYSALTWKFPGKQEKLNAAQVECLLRIYSEEPKDVVATDNPTITFEGYQAWRREQRKKKSSRAPA